MVVRMRHTRSHTANRRSHHALAAASFAICANCGAKKIKHAICKECGKYKDRQVIDIAGIKAGKDARKKEREKAEVK